MADDRQEQRRVLGRGGVTNEETEDLVIRRLKGAVALHRRRLKEVRDKLSGSGEPDRQSLLHVVRMVLSELAGITHATVTGEQAIWKLASINQATADLGRIIRLLDEEERILALIERIQKDIKDKEA